MTTKKRAAPGAAFDAAPETKVSISPPVPAHYYTCRADTPRRNSRHPQKWTSLPRIAPASRPSLGSAALHSTSQKFSRMCYAFCHSRTFLAFKESVASGRTSSLARRPFRKSCFCVCETTCQRLGCWPSSTLCPTTSGLPPTRLVHALIGCEAPVETCRSESVALPSKRAGQRIAEPVWPCLRC
jgi:hypothetical protein